MRLTAAVDGSILDDAKQLAATLGLGPADLDTFVTGWQDANGVAFNVASWDADPMWITAAQSTLARPTWDTTSAINMTGAGRAQLALTLWTVDMTLPMPTALIGALTVIGGIPPLDALAAMGLTQTPEPIP